MSEPMPSTPFERAPAGVVTNRPVLVRLKPEEREALQQHAKAVNTSLSAFGRQMILSGMRVYQRKHPANPDVRDNAVKMKRGGTEPGK